MRLVFAAVATTAAVVAVSVTLEAGVCGQLGRPCDPTLDEGFSLLQQRSRRGGAAAAAASAAWRAEVAGLAAVASEVAAVVAATTPVAGPAAAVAAMAGSAAATAAETARRANSAASAAQGTATGGGGGGAGPWLDGRPFILSNTSKPDGGTFTVWQFPLVYNNFTIYWRRFGVDLPKDPDSACPGAGCPVIVDFPGSGGTVYSEREWTKWHGYQSRASQTFILVTVEGSPDGISFPSTVLIGDENSSQEFLRDNDASSDTSWNVLGWGRATKVLSSAAGACGKTGKDGLLPSCTVEAMDAENNAYGCFGTQLAKNPLGCQNYSKATRATAVNWGIQPQATAQCTSATAANDWDYLKRALGFVVAGEACGSLGFDKSCADRSRIYYMGQSMGGMASIQFATRDPASPYYMGATWAGDLRPAAIVAASAGGSRNNDIDLRGEVPALLMQGSADSICAGSPVLGYMRRPASGKLVWGRNRPLTSVLPEVIGEAAEYLQVNLPNDATVKEKKAFVLQADVQQGGAMLAGRLRDAVPVCNDRLGNPTGLSASYYMWEGIRTTLHRVVGLGSSLDMAVLDYGPVPGRDAAGINMQCAEAGQATGASKQIRVCVFQGGHTYPLLDGNNATVFHEFVWEDFLRGGTLS